ncbi:DUF6884 domain-containing protein [Vibrio alginolyticus]|uniref:DUF6884 domain-containing protein n=1 Tax=Vibrio alginolyticus TaxID=663 RepID=UPI0006A7B943|nr:DUF6884 domain-containing protein [Vibrio alginolyticus]HCZ9034622.1 hypothetical protein [Vibrio alginolyticus]HCZ9054085.1 hypothetical protein [Vibrio alginolyticus]
MPEIHLLVPCSAQKTSSAPEKMCFSKHNTADLNQSLNSWLDAFNQTSERHPTSRLYNGQAFLYAKKLAEKSQFKLSILSAGFGLVTSNTELPSYNATFSANKDRVPSPQSSWWSSVCQSDLPGTSIFEYVNAHSGDQFIFCLSNEYLRAVQDDLLSALENDAFDNERIVIISSNVPKKLKAYECRFVKTSRNILNHSKAKESGLAISDRNVTSIALYMFVEQLRLTKTPFSAIIPALNEDFAKLKPTFKPKRAVQPIELIKEFIWNEICDSTKPVSATSILRKYRDSGFACSVERFGEFYKQVKSEKGLS